MINNTIPFILANMRFIILAVLIILIIFNGLFTIAQQEVGIIQRFGKYARIANAGLNIRIPFIEKLSGSLSLRIEQLDVEVETKTQDNVFVRINVAVQYFVRPERVYEAFYKLTNPRKQITSYVFDVVRARVPRIDLDAVFEKKDEIAIAVKEELSQVMEDFGYDIVKSLVTDIDPDPKVKQSMNEINAAKRMREAAVEKGEAEKILKVKMAEAAAEARALDGKGIADQRRAIVEGLQTSVYDFQTAINGVSATEVMNLVLVTQYFDTLKDVGSDNNTIMIPHSPGTIGDITNQIRTAIISAEYAHNTDNSIKKEKETKETI